MTDSTSAPLSTNIASLPLIARLNGDCLATIFFASVQDEYNTDDQLRRLLHLTHVCRAWRDLALGLAELWGDVVFANPNHLDVILERARDAPLSTYHPPKAHLHDVHKNFLMSHFHRFQRAEMRQRLDLAPLLVQKPTNTLTTAQIYLDKGGSHIDGIWHAPALRKLALSGCKLQTEAPKLQSLGVYRMADMDDAWLRALLSSLPLLQEFFIDHLPYLAPETPPVPIELPSIAKLSLGSNTLSTAQFIERLTPLNINRELDLMILRDHLNFPYVPRLANALGPYLRDSGCNSMGIKLPLTGVRFWKDKLGEDTNNAIVHERTVLSMGVTVRPLTERIIAALLEQIPPSNLGYFHLSGMPDPETRRIVHTPRLSDSVHTVVCEFQDIEDILAILGRCFLDPPAPTAYSKLQVFEMRCPLPLAPHPPDRMVELIIMLGLWLETRRMTGLPLQEVRVLADAGSSNILFNPSTITAWDSIQAMVKFVKL
ncbi:unnamed protein product [Peniophora sp. CBMAI 1063]|nr:unnamed protein product [Peniophora sp. CBMAI 1063]